MSESKPGYSFNPNLHVNTIDPPVQIGARWAQLYPSPQSPLQDPSLRESYPLLNLAQGVPGHPPPQSFLDRVAFEARPENASSPAQHSHGYGPVFGDPKLREAVARDINRVYRTEGAGTRNQVTQDNVAITAGCNLAFAAVAMSIAAPGDAIILCDPWYFNHQMTLTSLGIQVARAPISLETNYPDAKLIAALLKADSKGSPQTIKAVVLVTPNNPTGSIYPSDLIRDIAILCHRHGVALILDETYRDFILAGDQRNSDVPHLPITLAHNFARPHNMFEDIPAGFERSSWEPEWDWTSTIIHLFSFSKSYAIPGHRLGGFVAHSSFLQQKAKDAQGRETIAFGPTAKALDNLQVAPPRSDTQRAVAWAIEDPAHLEWRSQVAHVLRERREALATGLSQKSSLYLDPDNHTLLPNPSGLDTSPVDYGWSIKDAGAYYAWLRHPFEGYASEKVAQGLAELVGVVVLPGSFFMPHQEGASSDPESQAAQLRVSIANVSTEKLAQLPKRLSILSELWNRSGRGWGLSS